MSKKLINMELDEISLVDKGSNPGARVVLFKRDMNGNDAVKTMYRSITNLIAKLINNTLDDIEKSVSSEDLMKALSFNDMMALSANRQAMDTMGEKFGALHRSLISIIEDDEVKNKRMAAHESLNEFHESVLNSLKQVAKGGNSMAGNEDKDLQKQIDGLTEKLGKADEKLEKATGDIEILTKAKDDAEDKAKKLKELLDAKKETKKGDEIDKASLAPEVRKALEAGEDAKERVAKLEDEAIEKAFITKAETFSHLPIAPENLGKIMKGISGNIDEELYKEFEKMLKGAHEGMGKVFAQIGKDDGAGGDALEALNSKATEIAKRDKITFEAGFVKAGEENPELAKQEREERMSIQH